MSSKSQSTNSLPPIRKHGFLVSSDTHQSSKDLNSSIRTSVDQQQAIDYVLVYDANTANMELRRRFEAVLRQEGLHVEKEVIGNHVFVKIQSGFERMCKEAERVRLEMPLNGCEVADLDRNAAWSVLQPLIQRFVTDDEVDVVSAPFVANKLYIYKGHEDKNTFFRSALRQLLTHHILINADVREPIEKTKDNLVSRKGLAYLLMSGCYKDAFVLHDPPAPAARQTSRPSSASRVVSTADEANADAVAGQPANAPADARHELNRTWTVFWKFQPLWKIRNYFGEKIAFYFAWQGTLISSLWVPSIFGVVVFIYGLHLTVESYHRLNSSSRSANSTIEFTSSDNQEDLSKLTEDIISIAKLSMDNGVTPFFALALCVWGTLFLEIWKRKNSVLAYQWDVNNLQDTEPDRPQFCGTNVKPDPVTSEDMWYYPWIRQFMKFALSTSIILVMILVVCISVLGVIVYRVITLIDLCNSGVQCFLLGTVLPALMNAVSILIMGKLYGKVAIRLTDWENHRTQTAYNNALIIKLFAFQFANSYASLFYIAFFRENGGRRGVLGLGEKYRDSCGRDNNCMAMLSFQVLVLMIIKPFPRFFMDIIVPYLKRFFRLFVRRNQKVDIELSRKNSRQIQLLKEYAKPNAGDFTLMEFSEKVVQYGMMMLFASSLPIAPFLAIVINMIDLRVDAKRLLWWNKRPVAHIAQNIGMWYPIINFVNVCGVISNAFLIAFTSSYGKRYDLEHKLLLIIVFEHIVFAVKLIVDHLIPDVPASVQLAMRREKYQVAKILEDASSTNRTLSEHEMQTRHHDFGEFRDDHLSIDSQMDVPLHVLMRKRHSLPAKLRRRAFAEQQRCVRGGDSNDSPATAYKRTFSEPGAFPNTRAISVDMTDFINEKAVTVEGYGSQPPNDVPESQAGGKLLHSLSKRTSSTRCTELQAIREANSKHDDDTAAEPNWSLDSECSSVTLLHGKLPHRTSTVSLIPFSGSNESRATARSFESGIHSDYYVRPDSNSSTMTNISRRSRRRSTASLVPQTASIESRRSSRSSDRRFSEHTIDGSASDYSSRRSSLAIDPGGYGREQRKRPSLSPVTSLQSVCHECHEVGDYNAMLIATAHMSYDWSEEQKSEAIAATSTAATAAAADYLPARRREAAIQGRASSGRTSGNVGQPKPTTAVEEPRAGETTTTATQTSDVMHHSQSLSTSLSKDGSDEDEVVVEAKHAWNRSAPARNTDSAHGAASPSGQNQRRRQHITGPHEHVQPAIHGHPKPINQRNDASPTNSTKSIGKPGTDASPMQSPNAAIKPRSTDSPSHSPNSIRQRRSGSPTVRAGSSLGMESPVMTHLTREPDIKHPSASDRHDVTLCSDGNPTVRAAFIHRQPGSQKLLEVDATDGSHITNLYAHETYVGHGRIAAAGHHHHHHAAVPTTQTDEMVTYQQVADAMKCRTTSNSLLQTSSLESVPEYETVDVHVNQSHHQLADDSRLKALIPSPISEVNEGASTPNSLLSKESETSLQSVSSVLQSVTAGVGNPPQNSTDDSHFINTTEVNVKSPHVVKFDCASQANDDALPDARLISTADGTSASSKSTKPGPSQSKLPADGYTPADKQQTSREDSHPLHRQASDASQTLQSGFDSLDSYVDNYMTLTEAARSRRSVTHKRSNSLIAQAGSLDIAERTVNFQPTATEERYAKQDSDDNAVVNVEMLERPDTSATPSMHTHAGSLDGDAPPGDLADNGGDDEDDRLASSYLLSSFKQRGGNRQGGRNSDVSSTATVEMIERTNRHSSDSLITQLGSLCADSRCNSQMEPPRGDKRSCSFNNRTGAPTRRSTSSSAWPRSTTPPPPTTTTTTKKQSPDAVAVQASPSRFAAGGRQNLSLKTSADMAPSSAQRRKRDFHGRRGSLSFGDSRHMTHSIAMSVSMIKALVTGKKAEKASSRAPERTQEQTSNQDRRMPSSAVLSNPRGKLYRKAKFKSKKSRGSSKTNATHSVNGGVLFPLFRGTPTDQTQDTSLKLVANKNCCKAMTPPATAADVEDKRTLLGSNPSKSGTGSLYKKHFLPTASKHKKICDAGKEKEGSPLSRVRKDWMETQFRTSTDCESLLHPGS